MSSLRGNRDFTVFWLGQGLSVLGGSVSYVALPLFVLHVTGSGFQMGLVTGLGGAVAIAAGAFAGHVVDRVDRRRLMIGCDLARGVLLCSVPLLWALGGSGVWLLYGLTALVAVLKALFDVAYVTAVPALVDPADLAAANGRMMGSFAVGTMAGPLVAGALVAGVGADWALALDGATFLVSAASMGWVRFAARRAEPVEEPKGTKLREGFVVGFRFLWADALLRPLTVLLTLLTFVTLGSTDLLIFRITEELGRGEESVGYVIAVSGIGVVAAALAAGPLRRALGFGACWLGSTALIGVALAVIGTGRSLPVIAVAAVLFMFGLTVGAVCSMTLRQEVTPGHLLGRVTSAFWTVHNASGPVGAALLMWLAVRHGVPAVSLAAGTLCLLIAGSGLLTPLRGSGPGVARGPVAGSGASSVSAPRRRPRPGRRP